MVLVAVVVLVVVATAGGGSKPPASTGPDRLAAPAAVVSDLTGVPAPVFDQVGVPSGVFGPTRISNGKALTSGGKPAVVFVGDEWCPICATDRWPLAVALARFGTFSHLALTKSSSSDSFPDTNTLSFAGASYSSPYLAYQPVELQTRDRKSLETPSALQLSLLTGIGHDGVPVIDFGGRYLMNGASYDPAALADRTWQQIARALVSPADAATRTIQRDVVGTANLYTAAICAATGGQPAAVCSSTGVKVAAAALSSAG